MATTRTAKYRIVLQNVGARVVIAEGAAEVQEGNHIEKYSNDP